MKNLEEEDQTALRSALDRIQSLPTVRDDTDELILQKRLQLLRLDLSVGTDSVRADVHTPFRVLAKALLRGESNFLMMRRCLGLHLMYNTPLFIRDYCEGNAELCDDFLQAITTSGDCTEYWHVIFQICADLFKVTFYCIASAGHDSVFEFAPTSFNPVTKKDFWLVFNLNSYEGWNTLQPKGSDPFVPKYGKVMNIRFLMGQAEKTKQELDERRALNSCQFLVGDVGFFVPQVPPKTLTYVDLAKTCRQLDSRLSKFDYIRSEVEGDGNCFFRALFSNIFKVETRHLLMRSLVVESIRSCPEEYPLCCKLAIGESLEVFLTRMALPGVWGHTSFCQVVANVFSVKVIVFCSGYGLAVTEFYPKGGSYKEVIMISSTSMHVDVVVSTHVSMP